MTAVNRAGSRWRKSTRSRDKFCVEVAFAGQAVLTRDSKRPADAVLEFSADDWSAFLDGLRTDRFIC